MGFLEFLVLMIYGFFVYVDIGISEQELVNNIFIFYDGCDGKFDSDDENSEDYL